jgi:hypothetical protein
MLPQFGPKEELEHQEDAFKDGSSVSRQSHRSLRTLLTGHD